MQDFRPDLTNWLSEDVFGETGATARLRSQDLETGIYKVEFKNDLTSNTHLITFQMPDEADSLPELSCVDSDLMGKVSMYVMDNLGSLTIQMLIKKCLIFLGNPVKTSTFDDDEDWGSDDDEGNDWGDNDEFMEDKDDSEPIMPSEMEESQRYTFKQNRWVEAAEKIRKKYEKGIHEEELSTSNIFNPKAVSLMLAKQIVEFQKAYDNGNKMYSVEPIDDNIYTWSVKISNFEPFSKIHDDMISLNREHSYDYVEVELKFLPDIFPFFPPTVKLVRPRIENFVFARIVTMPELQLSKWNPTCEISHILGSIKQLIEKHGRVNPQNKVNDMRNDLPPFTEIEFQLLRLSMLTETPARCVSLEEAKNRSPILAIGISQLKTKQPSQATTNAKGKKAWAAGVGYGHQGDSKGWDIAAWERAQRKKESEVESIVKVLSKELGTQQCPIQVVKESCLLPFLLDYCKNDSLNDIARHFSLYEAIFRLLSNMLPYSGLVPLFIEIHNNHTLLEHLKKLYKKSKFVRNAAQKVENEIMAETQPKPKPAAQHGFFVSHRGVVRGHVSESAGKDYGFQIALMICNFVEALEEKMKQIDIENTTAQVQKQKLTESMKNYIPLMRELAFSEVEDMFVPHHYVNTKKIVVTLNRKLIKRLVAEFSDLPSSLPIDPDSSVFFRICESNMPFAQMLIIPPDGTPYAGGCFLFDICFPSKYPLVAPLVNLQTTGHGKVRFNPNLYKCGKVCLSLLGTWGGANQGEQWNPGLSTLLQVAISIQSLIFVAKPYFNEPGYEATMGTPRGDQQSKAYNRIREEATVKYAIIEMLEKTPPQFKDVIQLHFKLSRDRTLANVERWMGADSKAYKKVKQLLDQLQ